MIKIDKSKLLEARKKLLALAATGAIGLTSITGCAAKTNTESSTSEPSMTTTAVTTTVAPTETTAKVEIPSDVATEDYRIHAKEVAKAIYDVNKKYFDEKQYTVEDLENVIYTMNDKYFDSDSNLLMDKAEKAKSFAVITELVSPQRENELLEKQADYRNGFITKEQYDKEVAASTFFNYNASSLANFIDANEENNDVRNFLGAYSKVKGRTVLNIKNCVYPEELKNFFAVIRSAQNGDKTDFNNINIYLQETTVKPGASFVVAGIYKATADELNTVTDGQTIEVDGDEVVIGLTKKQQELVNAYYAGDLTETKDILEARKYIALLFQTHQVDAECNARDAAYYIIEAGTSKNVNKKTI